MSAAGYILALDLGTTGNRAFIFDASGRIVSQAYQELTQYYPQPGWLEHDPIEIWQATCDVMRSAIQQANLSVGQIAAIGLTVQRETCLIWDKTTGVPLHRAIVWQDRRTAHYCEELKHRGYSEEIFERTGLVIDAYFSATKLAWLHQQIVKPSGVDERNLLAGTIDTWILWKLTGGRVHATDDSNASRTMLYNLNTQQWDDRLLDLFGIPAHWLPQIQPSLSDFGTIDPKILGAAIPVTAILGDQQASLYGHQCDRAGLVKCTYGTGCFLVAHTGNQIIRSGTDARSPAGSPQQMIATIAWTESHSSAPGYALEGSLFTTGACVQWLRDGIGLIESAAETETLAQQVSDNGGVYFVPALSGLGAPHWDMTARGAFFGITGGAKRPHLVRAVLESIAFQVKEVVQAISESGIAIDRLKVDGGGCNNNFLMQLQADALGIPVERPCVQETTVQGIAFAAGQTIGFWQQEQILEEQRAIERIFQPGAGAKQAIPSQQYAIEQFAVWQEAVQRTKQWEPGKVN